MNLLCVCGARPNFMKIAPLLREFARDDTIRARLVHTGQHYDAAMSQAFFDELHLPRPDVNLDVGSGSHAAQTALILQRFEPILIDERPDAVLVVGDVNSTIACGLAAVKLGIPLIHVEAGLRSFDRSMPEEINRVLTDAISELLLVSEPSGVENLKREGVAASRIHLVGNVMIDTLRHHETLARQVSNVLGKLELREGHYGIVTLHRPGNVDDRDTFDRIATALETIQRDTPLVFPVHPRTRQRLEATGLLKRLEQDAGVLMTPPLGYLDFLRLMMSAAVVLTDSGGVQEETTALGVPCLTLRENTERPITLTEGTNQLVGMSVERILAGYARVRAGQVVGRVPKLWDGNAAHRIARVLRKWGRTRDLVAPQPAVASA